MKKIQFISIIFLVFFGLNNIYSQTKSGKLKNKGGSIGSRGVNKKAHIGGRETNAHGIDEDRIINIGLGGGVSFPGFDLLNEEHLNIGYSTHFYVHYLLPQSSKIGLGFNANYSSYITNKTKFLNELSNVQEIKTSSWNFTTISPSFLYNYNLNQRLNAQFIFNAGILLVEVPNQSFSYIDTINNVGEATPEIEILYNYTPETKLGWASSLGVQFNYVVFNHCELLLGSNFQYGRFKITRNEILPIAKETEILREMRLFNMFVGIALSF